jgi:large subunit ribosomal protein L19
VVDCGTFGRPADVSFTLLEIYLFMKANMAGVVVSPVNMEERKELGIRPGDTVRVHQKIQDKGKTRIQIFEGLVLARKHGSEPGATFTVRKVASGVGVEKIFPLYSPQIDKLEIVRRAKVRKAKLYYIREKVNREIKRQMRRMSLVSIATESGAEAMAREAEEAKKAVEEAEKLAEAEALKQAEEQAQQPAVEEAVEQVENTDTATEEKEAEVTEEVKEVATDEVAEVAKTDTEVIEDTKVEEVKEEKKV